MDFKQTSSIVCPYCKRTMERSIYDVMLETNHMSGEFSATCDKEDCERTFNVAFIFKPFVRTYLEQ